ncbi:MAG: hypothetical protein QY310_14090 [Candidatus Jettenia sp. CY-1]|nr:MAG: hypothetical protein QY310_14090 [Candidatus Jettenia sp. CY-1]
MFVLIVGEDHLGNIPRELDKLGITEIQHISGRSGQKVRDKIIGKKVFYYFIIRFC